MLNVTRKEGRLSLEQVAQLTGKHISTVRNWARPTDYKGRPKRYLETALLGGVRYTTEEELQRFQLQGPAPKPRPVAPQLMSEQEAYWRKRLREEHGVRV